jgi:aspartate/methionine/tyrosine aminotransferase
MSAHPRAQVERLRTSDIRLVANAGIGRPDVLPFWFGEADQPAAPFIRRAAAEALEAGLTFYSHNLGRPDLREALAGYLGRLHGRSFEGATLAITSSGVNALMVACQAVVEPGDRVVVITPVSPRRSSRFPFGRFRVSGRWILTSSSPL